MPDINPSAPAGTEVAQPQSYDEQVEGLSELLDDPETPDPVEAEEPEAEQIDDDPDGLNEISAEDVAADDDANPDGSEPEIKGGRFAPDSAKVTLDDGTVTTIAELKRGTLFQRDYTQKTQALATERKTFEAERESVSQYAQQLNQARDYIAWYAEQHLPKQPEPFSGDPAQDPMGYMQWQQRRDTYAQHLQAYQTAQQLKQQEEQRKAGETQQQTQQRLQQEADALKKAYPILNDATKGPQFLAATARDASKYFALTDDELRQTVTDRRLFGILRDAISFRRLKEKAPQVKEEIAKRPAMTNGRRNGPSATDIKGKQVRTERLRKTGSFEDGVASLQDFDL